MTARQAKIKALMFAAKKCTEEADQWSEKKADDRHQKQAYYDVAAELARKAHALQQTEDAKAKKVKVA